MSSNPIFIPTMVLNNGLRIPVLGLGTAVEKDEMSKVCDAVRAAITVGYRLIDTATLYGTESEVGRAVNSAIASCDVTRGELFILTKVYMDSMSRVGVMESARKSLERLGLDYVDCLLVHFPVPMKRGSNFEPDSSIDIYSDTWRGMEDVYRAGLAKSIGVSNYNAAQIEELVKVRIS